MFTLKCVFCDNEATYKFRNKGICEHCVEQIKLIYRGKHLEEKKLQEISEVQKTKVEKEVEKKEKEIIEKYTKKIAPQIQIKNKG